MANLPKPEGFIDPSGQHSLNFANSDLAFQGNHVFLGNFSGFNIYDVENTRKPRAVTSIVCPGGQGDVSIYGNLLFMSVEQTRGRIDCGVQRRRGPGQQGALPRRSHLRHQGHQQAATGGGGADLPRVAHAHGRSRSEGQGERLHLRLGHRRRRAPGEELDGCVGDPKDPNTALFSIDVIKVPHRRSRDGRHRQSSAHLRRREDRAQSAGCGRVAITVRARSARRRPNQCHDITVYPEVGLAAGACSGNGLLLDISDPVNPKRLDAASDKNFAYWHSASFNNDGTKVIFTDEWGGGTRPRCRATDLPTWGANAIFDVVDKKLVFRSYYKIAGAADRAGELRRAQRLAHPGAGPRHQGAGLVPGRRVGVRFHRFGANPIEIAYFDRGPVNPEQLVTAGYWSAYWYNGNLYGSEIARGIDIFRLVPTEHMTQAEIDAAVQVRSSEFNVQSQPRIELAG